jgi:hypothetical protein
VRGVRSSENVLSSKEANFLKLPYSTSKIILRCGYEYNAKKATLLLQIFINNEKLCNFTHRLPGVYGVEVTGDLKQLFVCESI